MATESCPEMWQIEPHAALRPQVHLGSHCNQSVWLCSSWHQVLAEHQRYSFHGADGYIFWNVTGALGKWCVHYLWEALVWGGFTPSFWAAIVGTLQQLWVLWFHRYSGTSTKVEAPSLGSAGLPRGRHTGSAVSLPGFNSHSASWLWPDTQHLQPVSTSVRWGGWHRWSLSRNIYCEMQIGHLPNVFSSGLSPPLVATVNCDYPSIRLSVCPSVYWRQAAVPARWTS